MNEETLAELKKDIALCSGRVLTQDCVMDLVNQYTDFLDKYGRFHENTIQSLVFQRILDLVQK
jgi:hypothetical protein